MNEFTEEERRALDVLQNFFWKFCLDPDVYEDDLSGLESLAAKVRA